VDVRNLKVRSFLWSNQFAATSLGNIGPSTDRSIPLKENTLAELEMGNNDVSAKSNNSLH
jgi:hypothetical protein